MVITIIILGILCCTLGYSTYNLLRKNERLEDTFENIDSELMDSIEFITKMELDLKRAFEAIKKADSKGGFEADDEVGQTFKTIKDIISELEDKYGNEDA